MKRKYLIRADLIVTR